VLADSIGIPGTFFTVGASFGVLSAANQMFMPESSAAVPPLQPHRTLPLAQAPTAAAAAASTLTPTPTSALASAPSSSGAHSSNAAPSELGDGSSESGKEALASLPPPPPLPPAPGVLATWTALLRDPRIFYMTLLNGGYWFVLSGSQMTLMPLMLVGEQFQLSASAIGGVFAGASVISVRRF
jgi:hypothetical protein